MTQMLQPRHLLFFAFDSIIFNNASASEYFLQNQNFFFVTEVRTWLIITIITSEKIWTKSLRMFMSSNDSSHHLVILLDNKWLHSVSNKSNGIKIGVYFTNQDKFTCHAELKNCKIENHSSLFWPVAQYIGSDRRRVLSPGVTCIPMVLNKNSQWVAYK